MNPPPVAFADGPEGRVAYQVVGEGDLDLLFMPFPARWNLDVIWDYPPLERYLRRLASFSRLVLFQARGTGISDPSRRPSVVLEEIATDARVVLDEIGSRQAGVLAIETGSIVAALFAASFPDRTRALVMVEGVATLSRAADYPWGMPPSVLERYREAMAAGWGSGAGLDYMAPHLAGDGRLREWWARLERLSISRAEVSAAEMNAWDVRAILPSVKAPTLVISHTGVPWIRPGHGRYVAEQVAGARYLERPGPWGVYWADDVDWTLDELQAFFTGSRGVTGLDDRVLATVMFTDIVGSTERAADLGDQKWRWLLDEHDALTRREVERFRGRFVKSTGDGALATFDGPARAIRCALALAQAVRTLGVEVRAGLHTGEVELRADDVGGIAVHIAERVTGEAGAGEVLVSHSVPPLVAGSGLVFDDLGSRSLKGVPDEWRLYQVRPQPA